MITDFLWRGGGGQKTRLKEVLRQDRCMRGQRLLSLSGGVRYKLPLLRIGKPRRLTVKTLNKKKGARNSAFVWVPIAHMDSANLNREYCRQVDATTDGPHNCELRSSDELAPPHQSTSSRTRVDLEQGRFNVHYPPLYGWSLVASGHEPVTLWS
ncbi:hypothetical protein TNCV_1658501 [Trichonephila clavipes]|nr:hypothetical protein TNCV_1658501 [Trichonephila clavipes]